MYIGAVEFPYIKSIKKNANKDVKMVWGAGLSHPVPYEALPGVNEVTIDGTLVSNSTYTKSLANQVEDLLSLKFSDVSQNSIISTDINGYLSVKSVTPAVDADKVGLREVSIIGNLYPNNTYQRKYVSNPVILTNEWSLTLGSNGCENYIALPKGATYNGGDGSTITRTGIDGTITLVKATTNNNIEFDLNVDEVNVGECKVYDDMNSGTESDWVRVFNIDHEFTGKIVIENDIIRVRFNGTVPKYYTNDGTNWLLIGQSKYRNYHSEDMQIPDVVVFKTISNDVVEFQEVYLRSSSSEKLVVDSHVIIGQPFIFSEVTTNTFAGWLQVHYMMLDEGGTVYERFVYVPASTPRFADLEFDSSTANVTSTDNFAVRFNPASEKSIPIFSFGNLDDTTIGVFDTSLVYFTTTSNTIGYTFAKGGIYNSSALNFYKECEAMTQGSGVAYYTGADAYPKTGNTGSILNAQNENVSYTLTGGTTLPLGTYKLFVRAKDSSAVANDLGVTVHNDTDSTDVMTPATQTLTTSWAYYGFDVTLASDDDTDTITVKLNKETATANTIDLDYVLWIPITSSDGNFPQDVAHQAFVDQNLRRELVLR